MCIRLEIHPGGLERLVKHVSVVLPVSGVKNSKTDHVKLVAKFVDRTGVERRHNLGAITKRSASECRQDNVTDALVDQRLKLRTDPSTHLVDNGLLHGVFLLLKRAILQVERRGSQLVKREDLVGGKEFVTQPRF